ncbi:MAG: Arc family DNA-binding protein [Lactobacillus iners]|nr:Arc family DNA-binding protein [Lactobacillus iners]
MKKQYLLRIPNNIKENLKKYGDEKGVSLNAVILSAIDDYIEKKGIK